MKSITQSAEAGNQGNAPTLPQNGAQTVEMLNLEPAVTEQGTTRAERAHQWLADFDQWTQASYDTARENAHTLDRLLQHATPHAIKTAMKVPALAEFPFAATLTGSLEQLQQQRRDVARALGCLIERSSNQWDKISPLLDFLALHLLRAQNVQFADELREPAWFGRGDERATNETPLFYALFERYLQHSDRAAALKADRLIISDILPNADPTEGTPAFFAQIWEETLVTLYDQKRDRLAVVTRTLPQHKRPRITDEQIKADSTLGLVVKHWERTEAPAWHALTAEREQLEEWLATEGLETSYWWARNVDRGLDDCDAIKPALALLLNYWKEQGTASDEITAEAIFAEYFKDDEEAE